MPSLPLDLALGRPPLVCLTNLLLLLLVSANGASLREPRLRGSDSDSLRGSAASPPNADMLKALEYIRSFPQRSGAESPRPAEERRWAPSDNGEEDKGEELLQAVLRTLQQMERALQPAAPRARLGPQKRHGVRLHRKLPLMFEDEEEDEEEEPRYESPFKRAKENVEEKYTPQNLATLQSVFEELDKLTGAGAARKRHDDDEEEEERDVEYEDGDPAQWGRAGGDDEEEEEEEDEEDDRREANPELDYINDNEEGAVGEDEGDLSKRSEDAEDAANLVDFYLLKVLEQDDKEVQKRESEEVEEEEEEQAEREASRFGDIVDPPIVYWLITMFQKYQIPLGDLLDVLKMSQTSRARLPAAPESSKNKLQRKTPEKLRREAILRVLGLGGENDAPGRERPHAGSPSRLSGSPAGRLGDPAPTQRRPSSSPRNDYDDTLDEDQLAAYLAAQMLAQNHRPSVDNRVTSQRRGGGERGAVGSFEKAVQEYLDRADSGRSEKRQSEDDGRGGETQAADFEDEAMKKLLSLLNPEIKEDDTSAKKI